MERRRWALGGVYRYGFNGKENDNEVKGEGNQQDYGMRIYDPRVGRFLSVDPLTPKYPELTPYQFASNRPIDGIDEDGLEYAPAGNNTGGAPRDNTSVQKYTLHPGDLGEYRADANLYDKKRTISLFRENVNGASATPVLPNYYQKIHDANVKYAYSELGYNEDGSRAGVYKLLENKSFNNLSRNMLMPMAEMAIGDGVGRSILKGGEVFYRAISEEAYASFKLTGKMAPGSETFISPTEAFSQDYKGVLLKFTLKRGTLSELEKIGVRNSGELINDTYGNMPLVKKGWKAANAFFKQEINEAGLQQINIGLGDGKALEILTIIFKILKC